MDKKPTVAIILAVLNEKDIIASTLTHLISLGADEVIVVDGGSQDETREIVLREFPSVRFFETGYPERAFQTNLGGFEAASDILLFVHADMQLSKICIEEVRKKISQGYIGGGFKKKYQPSSFLLDFYCSFLNFFYLGWMRCLVGTNAIFVRKEVFNRLRGFPEIPFLEDMIFSERLRKLGKLAVIQAPVAVSSRRYLRRGVIRQILLNVRVTLGHVFFHENPERLREKYEG